MHTFISKKRLTCSTPTALLRCLLIGMLVLVSSCDSSKDSTTIDVDQGGGSGDSDNPSDDDAAPSKTILVESTESGSATPATLTLAMGETGTISLVPDAGNQIVSVEGCEGVITTAGYEVSGPSEDCSVFVEFGPVGEKLVIDVFGDGTIQSGVDQLCEARETCETRLPANVPVRMSATAAPGWVLSHWTGCDNIDNAVCVVNMDGPEGVFPAFARSDEVTLNPDVILLTESQMDAIQELDNASVVFRSDVEGADLFEIDKILVSTRGNGFARRISRVIAISQTPILIQTRNVPISDIIDDGTIVWKGDPADGTDLEFIPAEGVVVVEDDSRALRSSIQIEAVVYDQDGNLATKNDQVTLAMGLSAQFTPDFGFEKSFGRDASIRFVAGAKVTAAAKLGYKVSLPAVLPVKLGSFRSPPIPIGPIVLLPKYEVFADIGGSVDTSVSVSTTFSLGGNLGLYKKSGQSWNTLNTLSASAQAPSLDKLEVNLNAGIWAGVDAEFLIYGIAGPFIKAGPNSGYQRTFSLQGNDLGCFKESAYYGAKASMGGRLDLIIWEATLPSRSISVRPVEITWMQDQAARCHTGVFGPPQNLVTSLDQDNAVLASWEPPEGIPLVKYSVFRDNVLLTSVWDLQYTDKTASENTQHCYHVVGFDSQGRSSVESEQKCVRTGTLLDTSPPSAPSGLTIQDASTATLELSWNASVDDSGVVAYLVQHDDTIFERSTEANARITQLLSGTEYCLSIIAIDAAGNRSVQSETQCGRTLPEDAGLWRMRIACYGREYALENQVDLQATQEGIVNFAGEGFDYPGTAIAYIVSGVYSADTGILDGRITYTFAADDDVRVDLFNVDLSTGDSGDVAMNQIQVTGCDTIVRFDLIDTMQASLVGEVLRMNKLPAMALNDPLGIGQ